MPISTITVAQKSVVRSGGKSRLSGRPGAKAGGSVEGPRREAAFHPQAGHVCSYGGHRSLTTFANEGEALQSRCNLVGSSSGLYLYLLLEVFVGYRDRSHGPRQEFRDPNDLNRIVHFGHGDEAHALERELEAICDIGLAADPVRSQEGTLFQRRRDRPGGQQGQRLEILKASNLRLRRQDDQPGVVHSHGDYIPGLDR
jgi:hypothetical protein